MPSSITRYQLKDKEMADSFRVRDPDIISFEGKDFTIFYKNSQKERGVALEAMTGKGMAMKESFLKNSEGIYTRPQGENPLIYLVEDKSMAIESTQSVGILARLLTIPEDLHLFESSWYDNGTHPFLLTFSIMKPSSDKYIKKDTIFIKEIY